MDEEESRQRALELYEAMPKDMREHLLESAWEAVEATRENPDDEVDPEVVATVVVDVVQYFVEYGYLFSPRRPRPPS